MSSLGKPSLTTHVGALSVGELFAKVNEKLLEGCELHFIKGDPYFPVILEGTDKKLITKLDSTFLKMINRNRATGKLREYYIIEKEKTEKAMKQVSKDLGRNYRTELKQWLSALDSKNFNMVFGSSEFKFFVIPGYCAITAWSTGGLSLDRAIAFWYPDDIKGLDEHFWSEWTRALAGRNEIQAKEEVKAWIKGLLEKS
jgi:hypothetical protein